MQHDGTQGWTLLSAALLAACSFSQATAQDAGVDPAASARERDRVWAHLVEKHDRNGDGRISRTEYDRDDRAFRNLDRDHDDVVTFADLQAPVTPPDSTTPMLRMRRGRASAGTEAAVGWFPRGAREPAPDFTGTAHDDGHAVALSSLRGQPVALIFGSFT